MLPATPPLDPRMLARHEIAGNARYRLQLVHPPGATWWDRFWSWVGTLWDGFVHSVLSRLHMSGAAANASADAILLLLVLAFTFVLVRLVVRMQYVRERDLGATHERLRDPNELFLRACKAAELGEYRLATQWLFVATLLTFELHGLIRNEEAATVGEFRRALASCPERLRDAFETLAGGFTQAVYADRPVDAALWERLRSTYLTLPGLEANAA